MYLQFEHLHCIFLSNVNVKNRYNISPIEIHYLTLNKKNVIDNHDNSQKVFVKKEVKKNSLECYVFLLNKLHKNLGNKSI